MVDHGFLWALATILGPLLLLAAMTYGVIMNGRRSRASKQRTEDATRALYREGNQQERRQDAMEDPVNSPPLAPDVSPLTKSQSRAIR